MKRVWWCQRNLSKSTITLDITKLSSIFEYQGLLLITSQRNLSRSAFTFNHFNGVKISKHDKKSENRTIDALDYLNYLYYCYICITVWHCICITVLLVYLPCRCYFLLYIADIILLQISHEESQWDIHISQRI